MKLLGQKTHFFKAFNTFLNFSVDLYECIPSFPHPWNRPSMSSETWEAWLQIPPTLPQAVLSAPEANVFTQVHLHPSYTKSSSPLFPRPSQNWWDMVCESSSRIGNLYISMSIKILLSSPASNSPHPPSILSDPAFPECAFIITTLYISLITCICVLPVILFILISNRAQWLRAQTLKPDFATYSSRPWASY